MFSIIRVGTNWDLVIVEETSPDSNVSKFYRLDFGTEGSCLPGFEQISADEAQAYFSGLSDGLGWEKLPRNPFKSLTNVKRHILKQRAKRK